MKAQSAAPVPELSFVNHDASNIKNSPHRQLVSRHVQVNYRRWKNREKTRSLRDSVKPMRSTRDAGTTDIPTTSKTATKVIRREEGLLELALRKRLLERTSPVTLLKKGNSDPFNCAAIPIAAEDHDMILFYRNVMIPAAYHLKSGNISEKGAELALADWKNSVSGLADQGTALAFIARNAMSAALCSGSPKLYSRSLTLRNKSTVLLRSKLAKLSPIDDPSLFWHILLLWTTEVYDDNILAAQIHSKFIIKFITELSKTKALFDQLEGSEVSMFQVVMYSRHCDEQMFGQHLVSPAFDMDGWVPTFFKPFMGAVAPHVMPYDEKNSPPIDSSIEEAELVADVKAGRQVFTSWVRRPSEKRVDMMLFIWGQHLFGVTTARLVKRDLKFRGLTEASSRDSDYNYAQQYLALSLLKWVRALSLENTVAGHKLYQGKILYELRVVLKESECAVGSEQFEKWKNARLWALYVGVKEKQQQRSTECRLLNEWFEQSFVAQIRNMKLSTWPEVVRVLEGFLFLDFLHPTAETWFEDIFVKETPAVGTGDLKL